MLTFLFSRQPNHRSVSGRGGTNVDLRMILALSDESINPSSYLTFVVHADKITNISSAGCTIFPPRKIPESGQGNPKSCPWPSELLLSFYFPNSLSSIVCPLLWYSLSGHFGILHQLSSLPYAESTNPGFKEIGFSVFLLSLYFHYVLCIRKKSLKAKRYFKFMSINSQIGNPVNLDCFFFIHDKSISYVKKLFHF